MPSPDWARAVVRLAPRVVVQTVGGEGLLVNLADESVFSLNESGARVADLLRVGGPPSVIVTALAETYGLARAAIEQDVTALLEVLLARGLIVVEGGDPVR
jgi:hypothetical protein